MNLEIITRNYEPTKRVRTHAEERAEKFAKFLREQKQIRFTFAEEKLARVCEIHLRAYGKEFHSKADSGDMLQSVDMACASMEKQLRRYKDKVVDRHGRADQAGMRSAAALEQLSAPDVESDDDDEREEY